MEFSVRKFRVRQVLLLLVCFLTITPAGRAAIIPPKDHYQALGLERYAKLEDIEAAYQHRRSGLADKPDSPDARQKLVEIQHAFYVLSHALRRRDYDIFGLDELEDAARAAKVSSNSATGSETVLQPWDIPPVEPIPSATANLTYDSFYNSVLNSTDAWIILLYSTASQRSRAFAPAWEKLSWRFEGVAKLARVELGEVKLASLLSETNWVTGYPHFPQGFPVIVVLRASCQELECLARYQGALTWLDIEDWVATKLFKLPRILYHSPSSLITEVIQKASPHQVRVVSLSNTGERASPFFREAAKTYREYAVFGLSLWRQENETFWAASLGAEAAPALLFIKDPGLKPVLYYGEINGSAFRQLMEEHKTHVLPQLRSISTVELGCDPAGYSRAGNETRIWYCVIVAGKPGFRLNYMRQILREVQETLTTEPIHPASQLNPETISIAAAAFREKRLSLVWLDGEAQKHLCYFYLHGESMMEACGPRRYVDKDDIPKIFMVRFEREENHSLSQQTRSPNIWQVLIEEDQNVASQIVSKYNGSEASREVVGWISKMIHEGDIAVNLPKFKARSPPLAPEELPPIWSQGQDYVFERTQLFYRKGKRYLFGLLHVVQQPTTAMLLFSLLLAYCIAVYIKTKQDRHKKVTGVRAGTHSEASTQSEVGDTVPVAENLSTGEGIPEDATVGLRKR